MLGVIIMVLTGLVLMVLGCLIWKKEKISILHSYHYDKVKDEHKKAFCTLSGIGVTVIGAGIIIAGIIMAITDSPWSMIAFAVGYIAGLSILIYAGNKYNKE